MALEELAVLADDCLGIGEPTVEEVADPQGREIYRVVGKINVEIKAKQETP